MLGRTEMATQVRDSDVDQMREVWVVDCELVFLLGTKCVSAET